MTGSEFSFNTVPVQFSDGDTIADALRRAHVLTIRESYALGRQEGVYCGIGRCGSCRVEINGWPNQLACLRSPHAGDRVRSYAQGERPSLPLESGKTYRSQQEDIPVVIVGGGLAGRAMADVLTEWGVPSLLIDERPWRIREGLEGEVCASVAGLFAEPEGGMRVVASSSACLFDIVAQAVILATGSVSVPELILGGRLPGVVTWDAVRAFNERGQVPERGLLVKVGPTKADWSDILEESDALTVVEVESTEMLSITRTHDGRLALHPGGGVTQQADWIGISGQSVPSLELFYAFMGRPCAL